jgi:hypothetical protein
MPEKRDDDKPDDHNDDGRQEHKERNTVNAVHVF